MRPEILAMLFALAAAATAQAATGQAAPREPAAAITAAIKTSLGDGPVEVMANGGAMMPACRTALSVSWLASTNAGFRTASVHCPSPSWTIYAGVRIVHHVTALVATRAIAQGGQIDAADTATRAVSPQALHGAALSAASLTGDLRAGQAIAAGTPITEAMTTLQIAIQSGQQVGLRVKQGGLVISAEGLALQNGAPGDMIEVENSASHRKFRAEVVRALPAASGIYALAPQNPAN